MSDAAGQAPLDPMQALAELSAIRLGDTDLPDVLNRIAHLAQSALPGAAAVSMTLVSEGVATTTASSAELAQQLDETQYEVGYGPCLAAAAALETVVVADMETDDRWPTFAADADRFGIAASVSVGIQVQPRVTGAMNVYLRDRKHLEDDTVELAETFAGYASVALANAHLFHTTAAFADQMATAMASRAAIEQAKGMLIAQRGVDPDEAFAILSRASQSANRKLRDIAQAMVDGGQFPHEG